MPTSQPPPEETSTGRMMREAILRELHRQPKEAEGHASEYLDLIARRLVEKAADGDIQAIKEVLDRIDGKSLPGVADTDAGPTKRTVEWKDHPLLSTIARGINSSPSTTGPSASPAS
jgi:hypothetical protein